jgi:exportin-7
MLVRYTLFFDWFYPDFVGILVQAVQIWGNCQQVDDPAVTSITNPSPCEHNNVQVMIPLLKFVAELVFNKGQRLTFDCSSPNGILLFRETSKVLVTYGNAILATSVVSDAYMEKYKGIGICLAVLKNALSGSYVNFGVFALYGDTALSDALRMTLQMALTIPLSELMAYPKAYRAYFGFIEVLCHNHMNFIADLDTGIFVQIIESVYEGMRSVLRSLLICTALRQSSLWLAAECMRGLLCDWLARHVDSEPDRRRTLCGWARSSASIDSAVLARRGCVVGARMSRSHRSAQRHSIT